jgi:sulfite dehydrogenase (quinone) subunit SoeC
VNPPYSMIFFTTLIGAAQGLLIALVGVDLFAAIGKVAAPSSSFMIGGGLLVLALCGIGLIAATFHLGRPMRGWRAAAMWRTSWLSREVIVLPVFMAVVFIWMVGHWTDQPVAALGLLAAALALLLYVCTAMIYVAVKAIREWSHPVTIANYMLLGIASGTLLATALSAWTAPVLTRTFVLITLCATTLATLTRGYALWRNLTLTPKTTLQSAIGVRHPRIVQKAQGAMGGTFNTREFFHGRSDQFLIAMRWIAISLFALIPAAVLAVFTMSATSGVLLTILFIVQYVGLLAERWSFFAEGQHPQNLYYRSIS